MFAAFPPVRRPTAAEGDRKGTGKGDKGTLPREERPEPDPEPQPGEDLDVRAGYLELINLWWVLRNQKPRSCLAGLELSGGQRSCSHPATHGGTTHSYVYVSEGLNFVDAFDVFDFDLVPDYQD